MREVMPQPEPIEMHGVTPKELLKKHHWGIVKNGKVVEHHPTRAKAAARHKKIGGDLQKVFPVVGDDGDGNDAENDDDMD